MMKKSIDDIIKLSKENPTRIYTNDDGTVVSKGKVFKNDIEHQKYLSKLNFGKVYKLDDGRVIFDGSSFKNEQHLKEYIELSEKTFKRLDRIKRFFGFKN